MNLMIVESKKLKMGESKIYYVNKKFKRGGETMKYIKMSAIVFAVTLLLSVVGANAATWMGFADVTLKSFSGSTEISTQSKQTYGYQSAQLSSARDNITSSDRAVQAKVTNSTWIDLRGNTKHDKFTNEITYFEGTYTHYVRAKRSTIATVNYNGLWFWDIEMPIES